MSEPWTIRRVVRWSAEDFAQRGLASPRLDAELLVAHALGLTRVKLYMDLDRELGADELARVRELVQRRRKREPVAYLLGHKEFWGRAFVVSPAVLVPRPDTETLVERALAILAGTRAPSAGLDGAPTQVEARDGIETRVEAVPDEGLEARAEAEAEAGTNADGLSDLLGSVRDPARTAHSVGSSDPREASAVAEAEASAVTEAEARVEAHAQARPEAPRILDLCTGSGCIGLTLACEVPLAEVVLADVSSAALEVARANLEALSATDASLSTRVSLAEGDLFGALRPGVRFDLIACNPPYLAEAELAACEPDVREHEPELALVSGPTGEELITRVAHGARAWLASGGTLLVEIGAEQGARARAILEAAGLEDVALHRDLAGRDRVVEGRARSL